MKPKAKTGRAARGLATLKDISKESGVSYKTIKALYAIAGAPAMTEPMSIHLAYVKNAASGAVKLPKDLADQMILIKFEKAKHSRDKEREWAEQKRLQNLEKRGQLVERADVRAQGAAFAVSFCSVMDAFEKDGPGQCVGRSELELHRIFKEHCDRVRAMLREAISRLGKVSASNVE